MKDLSMSKTMQPAQARHRVQVQMVMGTSLFEQGMRSPATSTRPGLSKIPLAPSQLMIGSSSFRPARPIA
jgi:hypothetical protein